MRTTIIRINEGTFIKTDAPIQHDSFEGDSEFGGAKHQQKKAAKQAARIERKTANVAARSQKKVVRQEGKAAKKSTRVDARVARKATKADAKVARKATRVMGKVDKHALKFDQRMNRRTTRQALGQGGDTGMAASTSQAENSASYDEELPIDDDSQNLLATDAQEEFQEPQMESEDYYEEEEPSESEEEPEYEGNYEDETEDPESEYFSGFADEFDKAHYEATGARNNRKMRKNVPKKKRVKPTFVSKDKIQRTTCGYNKIDIAASNFGGGSGTAPNPLTQALITLALVGFTGFLVYKYAK